MLKRELRRMLVVVVAVGSGDGLRTRTRIPNSVRVRVGFDVKGVAKSACKHCARVAVGVQREDQT
jgi:hypothetical protein